jgi:ataxia telangiectasia mutated family protein
MSSVVTLQGTWASEACLEKPTDILSHFFEPAVASLSTTNHSYLNREHATVFHQCAMFAEQQYHAILLSPDAIRWKMYVERKTQEIEHRKDQIVKTQHGSTQFIALTQDQRRAQALLDQDTEQFRQHNHAMDSFLEQAIDMYSRSLEASDDFDDDGTIRMCSLWFANFENPNLKPNVVRNALQRIPSRKYIFLAHQLSARLTNSSGRSHSPHQPNLQSLITRMCTEHPFHSLYQVYCLRADRTNAGVSRRQSSRHESSSQERAAAAATIFDKLRSDSKIGAIAIDVERVCNACLEWAKYAIKKKHASKPEPPFYVPETLLITQLHNVRVPVLTSHTKLDPTLKYDDCVWIDHFEKTYQTAGGVNLPKIIHCLGSDGKKYKQLASFQSLFFTIILIIP